MYGNEKEVSSSFVEKKKNTLKTSRTLNVAQR